MIIKELKKAIIGRGFSVGLYSDEYDSVVWEVDIGTACCDEGALEHAETRETPAEYAENIWSRDCDGAGIRVENEEGHEGLTAMITDITKKLEKVVYLDNPDKVGFEVCEILEAAISKL